ncbi:MAG: polysaccharide deacetylase family protein [Bdellovibrionales bacterium]
MDKESGVANNEAPMYFHVDMDNLWIYEKEFGALSTASPEALYSQAAPRMLKLFDEFSVKATFFIVGRDLEFPSCQSFCEQALDQGHAFANHSYTHPTNLSEMSFDEKKREIKMCHEALQDITGIAPIGFRGPGYYIDQDMLDILIKLGYHYDSSILPGLSPTLMGAYLKYVKRSKANKKIGSSGFLNGRLQKVPHSRDCKEWIQEIPVAVTKYAGLPIHSSFIFLLGPVYLSLVNRLTDFKSPMGIYLLHGIDTLELHEKCPLKNKVPSLKSPLSNRMALLRKILKSHSSIHTNVSLEESLRRSASN